MPTTRVELLSYDPIILEGRVNGVPQTWHYMPEYQHRQIKIHLSAGRVAKALLILKCYERRNDGHAATMENDNEAQN